MTDQAIQVVTTADNHELAEHIATHLVKRKLVACVQVEKSIESFYRWKGKVEFQKEWRCTAKTLLSKYDEVEAAIKSIHAYETPEIIATAVVSCSEEYLEWIQKSVV